MKYSREQRDCAVDLYIKYDRCAADVIRELGSPSRETLRMWYRDRLEEERAGVPSRRGERYRRYSDEQKRVAVDHYLEYGRWLSRTMRMLGYPKSRELLMAWGDGLAPGRCGLRHGPVPEELKREAVVAVASDRLKSREAAKGLDVEASVVRNWKRQMLAGSKEAPATRRTKERPAAPVARRDAAGLADTLAAMEGKLAALQARLDELDAGIEARRQTERELDIQIAIRQSTLELLGKEPGADPEDLTNREKTILVGTTSERLAVTVKSLLPMVGLAHSTYHYQRNAMERPDRDAWLLPLVEEAFEDSERRYGHKRVHLELRGIGICVSAKRVMRLMARHGMVPLCKSAKRYGSYKGELTDAPANLVNRDFHAEAPNMLWVRPDGVRYPGGQGLSVSGHRLLRRASHRLDYRHQPNAALSNGMLADACSTLGEGERPIIHGDRGCHCRWPEWIRICEENSLMRSMSAKGRSPDNAAAEGFFGRLKQEFFHKRSFKGCRWANSSACSTTAWSGTGTNASRPDTAQASWTADASSDSWHNQTAGTKKSKKTAPLPFSRTTAAKNVCGGRDNTKKSSERQSLTLLAGMLAVRRVLRHGG